MKRQSNKLFYFVGVTSTLITICIITIVAFLFSAQHDTLYIYELSTIRGSIQRTITLSLANQSTAEETANVNQLLDKHLQLSHEHITLKNNTSYLTLLKYNFKEITTIISEYNQTKDIRHIQILVDTSEECWRLSDELIAVNENSYNRKLFILKLVTMILLIIIIITVMTILYIKTYVRDQLENNTLFDSLTNAYNRRYFDTVLDKELICANSSAYTFSLILFDIDSFKEINDTYGHTIGDEVLISFTQVIQSNLTPNGIFSRYGGDEFVLILRNTDLKAAHIQAQKINQIVENSILGQATQITTSVGVTEFIKGDTKRTIINRTDIALYQAKNEGKNRVIMNMLNI